MPLQGGVSYPLCSSQPLEGDNKVLFTFPLIHAIVSPKVNLHLSDVTFMCAFREKITRTHLYLPALSNFIVRASNSNMMM